MVFSSNIERTPLMKVKVIIIALVVFGLGACTQKTCPTYAKSVDAPKTEQAKV